MEIKKGDVYKRQDEASALEFAAVSPDAPLISFLAGIVVPPDGCLIDEDVYKRQPPAARMTRGMPCSR